MIDRTHHLFTVPAYDQVIWRYMDLGRFMSMLQSSALWLSRVDLLGDPHEGAFGLANKEARRYHKEITGEDFDAHIDRSLSRQLIQVNCWHMNDRESAAMWSIYQKEGRGIAVRSTVEFLDRSLKNRDHERVFLGKVRYVDYETTLVPEHNVAAPVLYKRLSFDYEREVRLTMIYDGAKKDAEGNRTYKATDEFPVGYALGVDLSMLIQDVYLAPGTPSWFGDVVGQAMSDAGVSVKPKQSSLDATPLF